LYHARGVEGVAVQSAAAAAEGGERFGAGTETEDAFGPFFATGAGGGSELKRHARRVSSVENTNTRYFLGDAVERETSRRVSAR
jgi:hypothetical protein